MRTAKAEVALGFGLLLLGIVIPWEALPKVAVGLMGLALIIYAAYQFSRPRDVQPVARLAFSGAEVVTVAWTIAHATPMVQGSNFSSKPLPVTVRYTQTQMGVARALIENASHGSMVDVGNAAGNIAIWGRWWRRPFPTFRARPPGNKEPWQASSIAAIPNRVDIRYMERAALDVAIRHQDTDLAYGFNTESYDLTADPRGRAELPKRRLLPGRYVVRVRAASEGTNRAEGWFELVNGREFSFRMTRRPRLAWLLYRGD